MAFGGRLTDGEITDKIARDATDSGCTNIEIADLLENQEWPENL